MAESEEEPQLRRGEAPAVGRPEKKHAKGLLFGLKADGHHAAQSLRERQLAKSADRPFFFARREGIIAQGAKSAEAAEAPHGPAEETVQSFGPRRPAELIT